MPYFIDEEIEAQKDGMLLSVHTYHSYSFRPQQPYSRWRVQIFGILLFPFSLMRKGELVQQQAYTKVEKKDIRSPMHPSQISSYLQFYNVAYIYPCLFSATIGE